MCSFGAGVKWYKNIEEDQPSLWEKTKWLLEGAEYTIMSNIRAIPCYTSPSYARDNYFRFNPAVLAEHEYREFERKKFTKVAEQIRVSSHFSDLVKRLRPLLK
mmetsp:Transcript_38069/g.28049  ORF Transcript_38069/g.28049 Transcript_38069/m.28049 type:complete len:103 (+) Transcript_38069:786-1094(+)